MTVENIFGVQEADVFEDTTSTETPSTGLVLNLSDEDLDGQVSQYEPIPQGTVTSFNIYEVETRTSKSGSPMWSLTLTTTEDTWGPNKRVKALIVFHPKTGFNWGPFLKATGLVQGAGQINFDQLDPQSLVGKTVMAKVLGYSWKDAGGSYVRNYGKNKQPLPLDGTAYYEDLGNWAPYEERSGEGLGEFSTEDYI